LQIQTRHIANPPHVVFYVTAYSKEETDTEALQADVRGSET